jgi:ferredoxin
MTAPGASYEGLCADSAATGVACRGGFHPTPEDGVPAVTAGEPARTVVLLGFTGGRQWRHFTLSPEYRDGEPHPLDRWSRRIIGALARRFGARELYPDTGPPWWPFQRWARRAEALHVSPLGILIHPEFGLWHAYRGALVFAQPFAVPQMPAWPHPCERCAGKPCLSSCPVEAIAPARFERALCMRHVASPAGGECRSRGCLARRSCPVGAAHRYGPEQAAFHMRASLETFTWERR